MPRLGINSPQSVCGISLVEDYYRLQKFNIMEISNAARANAVGNAGSRISQPQKATYEDAAGSVDNE